MIGTRLGNRNEAINSHFFIFILVQFLNLRETFGMWESVHYDFLWIYNINHLLSNRTSRVQPPGLIQLSMQNSLSLREKKMCHALQFYTAYHGGYTIPNTIINFWNIKIPSMILINILKHSFESIFLPSVSAFRSWKYFSADVSNYIGRLWNLNWSSWRMNMMLINVLAYANVCTWKYNWR